MPRPACGRQTGRRSHGRCTGEPPEETGEATVKMPRRRRHHPCVVARSFYLIRSHFCSKLLAGAVTVFGRPSTSFLAVPWEALTPSLSPFGAPWDTSLASCPMQVRHGDVTKSALHADHAGALRSSKMHPREGLDVCRIVDRPQSLVKLQDRPQIRPRQHWGMLARRSPKFELRRGHRSRTASSHVKTPAARRSWQAFVARPVSYTHLTLPTKRIV